MGYDGRSRQPLITTEQWKFEQEPSARRQIHRHAEQQEDGQEREHPPWRSQEEPRRVGQRRAAAPTLGDGGGSRPPWTTRGPEPPLGARAGAAAGARGGTVSVPGMSSGAGRPILPGSGG